MSSASGNSQPQTCSTPPQIPPFSGPCVEKELDASFVRALHLLHSTDPEAKHELRRLVEQQIEHTTASNKSHPTKLGFLLDVKKPVGAPKFKEKSPQVVTTTTTLVSGGVNTMHMEDNLSPLAKMSRGQGSQLNRLSSSSSNDEAPLPPNPRRVAKQSSPKRIKLSAQDLTMSCSDSDDSIEDNSTENDSFDDNTKEPDKSDHPIHTTPPPKTPTNEPTRPIRTSHKTTFLPSVEKVTLGHLKRGHHGTRGIAQLTHKKHLNASRLKGKTALSKQLLKKQLGKI